MKNVRKIIDLFGGIAEFKHVKIQNEGWMPLTIERIGEGPQGLPLFSVCHYYEQNGDLMADPEMTFEILSDGQWNPISFRNDGVGVYQEGEAGAMFMHEDGKVRIRRRLFDDLRSFARLWNKNIGEQGFVQAAMKQTAPVRA